MTIIFHPWIFKKTIIFSPLKIKPHTEKTGIVFFLIFGNLKEQNVHTLYLKMDPISSLFVEKIATFVEQSSKVLDVKIAMIGTGGLVGWMVWWELQNYCADPFLVNHCSNWQIEVQTFWECSSPSTFMVCWEYVSGSSQIRVPSKALGVVGSCGWVKRRSAKGQYWLCAVQINFGQFLHFFWWVKGEN